jgi:hypothetical protein
LPKEATVHFKSKRKVSLSIERLTIAGAKAHEPGNDAEDKNATKTPPRGL